MEQITLIILIVLCLISSSIALGIYFVNSRAAPSADTTPGAGAGTDAGAGTGDDTTPDAGTGAASPPDTTPALDTTTPAVATVVVPDPIDCQVSDWSDWSLCDNQGLKSRTRTITVEPYGGGELCPVLSETIKCKMIIPSTNSVSVLEYSEKIGSNHIEINPKDNVNTIENKINSFINTAGRDQFKAIINNLNNRLGIILNNTKDSLVYLIDVTENATYSFDFEIISPGGNSDSFLIELDGKEYTWNIGIFNRPTWRRWNSVYLTKGIHKLLIKYREPTMLLNLKIQKSSVIGKSVSLETFNNSLTLNINQIELFDENGVKIPAAEITPTLGIQYGNSSTFGPQFLIDGKGIGKSRNVQNEGLAHTTGSASSFMKLTLAKSKKISKVIIHNRRDCCGDRIVGARLVIRNESNSIVKSYPISSNIPIYEIFMTD